MGLEYARELAAKGYELVLVSNREDDLAAARSELSSFPVKVHTYYQDLAAEGAADALFARYMAEFSEAPTVLINNAGMYFFKELQIEDLPRVEAMLNLHVHLVTRLTILFGAEMKKRGSGYILNMSSMTARIPAPGISIYAATKAYLRSFGEGYYFELRPYGVGLTTVCPAAVATPLYSISEKWMRIGIRTGFIKTPRQLCRRALRAMFRRRKVVSPSCMNVWLPALVALLPTPLEAAIWKRLSR